MKTLEELGCTPGPWFLARDAETIYAEPVGTVGVVVFDIGRWPYKTANAHLALAAPDLYEALRVPVDRCRHSTYPEEFEQAKAALLKAAGSPPEETHTEPSSLAQSKGEQT